jgi:hypothetical protein
MLRCFARSGPRRAQSCGEDPPMLDLKIALRI